MLHLQFYGGFPLSRHQATINLFWTFFNFGNHSCLKIVYLPLKEVGSQSYYLRCSFFYLSVEGMLPFYEASIKKLGVRIMVRPSMSSSPSLQLEWRGESNTRLFSTLIFLRWGFYYMTRPSLRWAWVGHDWEVWEGFWCIAFLISTGFLASTLLTYMDPLTLKKLKWVARTKPTVLLSSMLKPKKVHFDSLQCPPTNVTPRDEATPGVEGIVVTMPLEAPSTATTGKQPQTTPKTGASSSITGTSSSTPQPKVMPMGSEGQRPHAIPCKDATLNDWHTTYELFKSILLHDNDQECIEE